MNKLATLLMFAALMGPLSALAQPEDGPRDRPDRDRAEQRERGERPGERGRPSDRDGDRGRHSKRGPLKVEQVQEALETLRAMHGDANPAWLERIEKQAKEDPEAAAKSLARFPRIREMMEARKHRPEEFALQSKQGQLMREVFPLVRELKQAQRDEDQDKIASLKPQIRERIEQLFQVRLELKEIEIKRIREKLAAAEKELSDIQADGEALIDEKMNEIIEGKGPRGPRDGSGPREGGERGDRGERVPNPERPERGE